MEFPFTTCYDLSRPLTTTLDKEYDPYITHILIPSGSKPPFYPRRPLPDRKTIFGFDMLPFLCSLNSRFPSLTNSSQTLGIGTWSCVDPIRFPLSLCRTLSFSTLTPLLPYAKIKTLHGISLLMFESPSFSHSTLFFGVAVGQCPFFLPVLYSLYSRTLTKCHDFFLSQIAKLSIEFSYM